VHVHRPDVVLVLGDQLDEGGYPTSDPDYEVRCTYINVSAASRQSIMISILSYCRLHVKSYVARFKTAFASASSVETIYLVQYNSVHCGTSARAMADVFGSQIGNHDSAFGRFLTPAAIARHERAFGLSNYATTVKGHRIVCLNTMALDADVADVEVHAQASR
jgi:hypothetical protein